MYGKFLTPAKQLAKEQSSLAQNGKKRLAELSLASSALTKKSKLSESEEEEEEEEEEREAQYEAFYSQWQSLEDRMVAQDETLERDWLALKPRITAVLKEREIIGTVLNDDDPEFRALVVEREQFQSRLRELKQLEAEMTGRDLEQETAQFRAEKEAKGHRFKSLQDVPAKLLAMREDVKGLRTLAEPEFRALVRPVSMSALLASVLSSSEGSLSFAPAPPDYVVLQFVIGEASSSYFMMVHKDVLLL
jgi:hypothetical protein